MGEQREPDASVRVAIDSIVETRDPVEHHFIASCFRATEIEARETKERRLRDQHGLLARPPRVKVVQHAVDEVKPFGDETGRIGLDVVPPQPAVRRQRNRFIERVLDRRTRVVERLGEIDPAPVLAETSRLSQTMSARVGTSMPGRSSGAPESLSPYTVGRSFIKSVAGTSITSGSTCLVSSENL